MILTGSTGAFRLSAVFLILMFATVASRPLSTCGVKKLRLAATPNVAVGAQYDSTHVYVTAEDFDHFVASVVATFGGTTSKQAVTTVTPTPSDTISEIVSTPVGMFSVFGYKTSGPLSLWHRTNRLSSERYGYGGSRGSEHRSPRDRHSLLTTRSDEMPSSNFRAG